MRSNLQDTTHTHTHATISTPGSVRAPVHRARSPSTTHRGASILAAVASCMRSARVRPAKYAGVCGSWPWSAGCGGNGTSPDSPSALPAPCSFVPPAPLPLPLPLLSWLLPSSSSLSLCVAWSPATPTPPSISTPGVGARSASHASLSSSSLEHEVAPCRGEAPALGVLPSTNPSPPRPASAAAALARSAAIRCWRRCADDSLDELVRRVCWRCSSAAAYESRGDTVDSIRSTCVRTCATSSRVLAPGPKQQQRRRTAGTMVVTSAGPTAVAVGKTRGGAGDTNAAEDPGGSTHMHNEAHTQG